MFLIKNIFWLTYFRFLLHYLCYCMCFLSFHLDSIFIYRMCICMYLLHFTGSTVGSRSWKRKDSSGILPKRGQVHAHCAATMQFHFNVGTFRPIHPSLVSPIREDGQVNKSTWKTSSSRRYWTINLPPPQRTVLFHPHMDQSPP